MKNVLILAVLALSVPAVAQEKKSVTLPDLLNEVAGAKTFKVHAAGFRPAVGPDGGTVLETACYRTATVAQKDGGTLVIDMGQGECKLSKTNETAVLKALTDSAAP